MRTFNERFRKIKQTLLGTFLAVGMTEAAYAGYAVPEHYRGNCPDGYFNLVTDPADVPANYSGRVTEYALPSDVCVRRVEDSHRVDENFTKDDFIVIEGSDIAPFVPFASGIFETWGEYEPILGHFARGRTYTDANNPRLTGLYKDYSGSHPVFVKKAAKAALKIENGIYLFDKQTQVYNGWSKRCPEGYSTVGISTTCYSRKNALTLNRLFQLTLVELSSFTKHTPDQECPLGYALANGVGPSRGICTSVMVLLGGVEKYGIPVAKDSANCADGTRTTDSVTCLPDLTAVYCEMDANAQLRFPNYQYSIGRHVFYWPTAIVENGGVRLRENYRNITTGTVSIDDLRRSLNLFSDDDGHIVISPVDSGRFPVFHLYSGKTCDQLWSSGGWSMEPMPTFW